MYQVSSNSPARRCGVAACALLFPLFASGGSAGNPGTSPGLTVTAIAEVAAVIRQGGRDVTKLLPADRVVPGDELLYTLEIRNAGPLPVHSPVVVQAVPPHMRYVAASANGPGADVTFSIDGGQSFDRPDKLQFALGEGAFRRAAAADYTHIRWRMRVTLKTKSVAFARFRAIVE